MDEINPYAPPSAASEAADRAPGRVRGVLAEAWKLFTENVVVTLCYFCLYRELSQQVADPRGDEAS